MYEARVERDSITQYGERLTTFVVTFPRFILAEFNTPKILSKSSASSRAIPVKKQIERLTLDPFFPIYWGKNQSGMSAAEELSEPEIAWAKARWESLRDNAIHGVEALTELGLHKQIANRPLETFMWHTAIVSGTEWSNFFHLRDNEKAQPEFQKVAGMMNELYRDSRPKLFSDSEKWHLPFVDSDEYPDILRAVVEGSGSTSWQEAAVRCSVGRCARVSYLNHEGKRSYEDDFRLTDNLVNAGHMAPYEHVARPMTVTERQLFERDEWIPNPAIGNFTDDRGLARWIRTGRYNYFLGNFNGWVQARKLIPMEHDALAIDRSSL